MSQITLEAARVNAGLKQEEMANMLGVTRDTLRSWESGKTYPRIDVAVKMAKAYGISIDDIRIG